MKSKKKAVRRPRSVKPAKRPAAKAARKRSSARRAAKARGDFFDLRLFVAGQNERSLAAMTNLRTLCDEYLEGRYRIRVIDLLEQPQLARGDQILAVPTVVRRLPTPIRRLVGDLSDTARALVGLDLRRRSTGKPAKKVRRR